MYPVSITGRIVALREFSMEDVSSALNVVGDERVTDWLSFDSRDRSQTERMLTGIVERARLEPRDEYYLAVALPPADRVIGFARLGLDGIRAGKLGYAIQASEWGHGYATDAAQTLTNFGFAGLKLHRISAAIGPDNTPSIGVVTRLGFSYEGRIRDHVYTNDAWRDSLLYSVLEGEWDYSITNTAA
jgi:[ribosomal protein S5]-alanine N-acetyltransferase